jgi:hypothetical protein
MNQLPKHSRHLREILNRRGSSQVKALQLPRGYMPHGRGGSSVVDLELQVLGLKGLRVADASVMPAGTRMPRPS